MRKTAELLPSLGCAPVWGVLPATIAMRKEYERKTVIPKVIFSQDSAGNRNVNIDKPSTRKYKHVIINMTYSELCVKCFFLPTSYKATKTLNVTA